MVGPRWRPTRLSGRSRSSSTLNGGRTSLSACRAGDASSKVHHDDMGDQVKAGGQLVELDPIDAIGRARTGPTPVEGRTGEDRSGRTACPEGFRVPGRWGGQSRVALERARAKRGPRTIAQSAGVKGPARPAERRARRARRSAALANAIGTARGDLANAEPPRGGRQRCRPSSIPRSSSQAVRTARWGDR